MSHHRSKRHLAFALRVSTSTGICLGLVSLVASELRAMSYSSELLVPSGSWLDARCGEAAFQLGGVTVLSTPAQGRHMECNQRM